MYIYNICNKYFVILLYENIIGKGYAEIFY